MHDNLFSQGYSTANVRASIKRDYARDRRVLMSLAMVLLGSIAYLAKDQKSADILAIFLMVASLVSGLRLFVDQSTRNFFLHRLDWEDAKADEESASRGVK